MIRTSTFMVSEPPYALEFFLLQDTQEPGLGVERHIADFVEKEGSAMTELKFPNPFSFSPGEGAFFRDQKVHSLSDFRKWRNS